MVKLVFAEVRMTPEEDAPILLLREADGSRHLAVWITAVGGNAILSALEGDDEDGPSTHGLMLEALSVLDGVVEVVRITGVHEGVFAAEASINGHTVPCRVSDGVALALRSGAPILAAESLMEQASILFEGDGTTSDDPDEQVEQFREFLDQINADDFDSEP